MLLYYLQMSLLLFLNGFFHSHAEMTAAHFLIPEDLIPLFQLSHTDRLPLGISALDAVR